MPINLKFVFMISQGMTDMQFRWTCGKFIATKWVPYGTPVAQMIPIARGLKADLMARVKAHLDVR